MNVVEPIKNLNDIQRIKDYLSNNKRNYLLFSLGINSGLRISDILALDVKDVEKGDTLTNIVVRLENPQSQTFLKTFDKSKFKTLIGNVIKLSIGF